MKGEGNRRRRCCLSCQPGKVSLIDDIRKIYLILDPFLFVRTWIIFQVSTYEHPQYVCFPPPKCGRHLNLVPKGGGEGVREADVVISSSAS